MNRSRLNHCVSELGEFSEVHVRYDIPLFENDSISARVDSLRVENHSYQRLQCMSFHAFLSGPMTWLDAMHVLSGLVLQCMSFQEFRDDFVTTDCSDDHGWMPRRDMDF